LYSYSNPLKNRSHIVTPAATPLLVLSRDASLLTGLGLALQALGPFKRREVADIAEARRLVAEEGAPGAALIHLTRPCADTFDFISNLKAGAAPEAGPVIVFQPEGARLGAPAFRAGADDMVTWPCDPEELPLRLAARLGLPRPRAEATGGDWQQVLKIVARAGLTASEQQVFQVLYLHAGKTVSREDLSQAVEGRPWRYGDRKFDVHVATIRKKLALHFGERLSVTSVRAQGYRLEGDLGAALEST
jgi:DNA-binding response OmpR family regulator